MVPAAGGAGWWHQDGASEETTVLNTARELEHTTSTSGWEKGYLSVDGLRGVLALWVAVGHFCSGTEWHTNLANSFAMPFFFIISGCAAAAPSPACVWSGRGCDDLDMPTAVARPTALRCGMAGRFVLVEAYGHERWARLTWTGRPQAGSEGNVLNSQRFLWRRLSRMAPVYYLTNIAGFFLALGKVAGNWSYRPPCVRRTPEERFDTCGRTVAIVSV
jgi:hypothetical protein